MALEEIRQTIETQQTIGEERVQALLRAEAIVPGAGRESVHILLEEARLCIGAVDVQTDRVVADGTIHAQALYRLGDEGEAAALAASAPLSRAIEIPGAQAGMSCLADGQIEHVEAAYENGHIVFQISVALHVRVLNLEQRDVITGLSGDEGIEQKHSEIKSVKLSAESSAEAILEGDARMPPVLDARTALMDWGSIRVEDASADLGGVRVSGSVLAEALVGSGVPGRPVALVKYTLPFEQLVDLPDWLCGNVEASARLNKLSAALQPTEDGGTSLHFRAEADITVKAMGEDSAALLSDAYGTGQTDVTCAYDEIAFCAGVEQVACRETVRANMLLPEGSPSAGTVIAMRARPQIGQTEQTAAGTKLMGILETQALYLASGSGALCSAREDLPFAIDCPFAISESDDIRLDVESVDASALMNDRLEVSCVLRAAGIHRIEETARAVSAVQTAPAEKTPFSVVLYWPGEQEDLWEIGRRYRIPSARLTALNAQRQTGDPLVVRG